MACGPGRQPVNGVQVVFRRGHAVVEWAFVVPTDVGRRGATNRCRDQVVTTVGWHNDRFVRILERDLGSKA